MQKQVLTALVLALSLQSYLVSQTNLCRQAIAADKAVPQYLQKALTASKNENYDAATAQLDVAIEPIRKKAKSAEKQGRPADAFAIYRDLDKDLDTIGRIATTRSAENLADMARLQVILGKQAEARELISEALERVQSYSKTDSHQPYILARKALVEAGAARREAALDDSRMAIFLAGQLQMRRFHKLGWKCHAPRNTFPDTYFDPLLADCWSLNSELLAKLADKTGAAKASKKAAFFMAPDTVSQEEKNRFAGSFKPFSQVVRASRSCYPTKDISNEANAFLADAKKFGESSTEYLMGLMAVANAYSACSEYQKSESLLLTAFALSNETFGDEHPYTLQVMEVLAHSKNQSGKLAEAEKLYKEHVALVRQLCRDSWCDESNALQGLLNLYSSNKNADGEISVRKRLVALHDEQEKENVSRVFEPLLNLAKSCIKYERYDEAAVALRRLLALQETTAKNQDGYNQLEPLNLLGKVELSLGKPKAAVELYKKAIVICEHKNNSYQLPEFLQRCANALRKANLPDDAERYEMRARSLRVSNYPSPF